MRIKDGTKIELQLSTAHGERTFGRDTGTDSSQVSGNGIRYHWMTLQVALRGKRRGVPNNILFEVDVPIEEMGRLIAGDPAHGLVSWSLDDRLKRAKAKEK